MSISKFLFGRWWRPFITFMMHLEMFRRIGEDKLRVPPAELAAHRQRILALFVLDAMEFQVEIGRAHV